MMVIPLITLCYQYHGTSNMVKSWQSFAQIPSQNQTGGNQLTASFVSLLSRQFTDWCIVLSQKQIFLLHFTYAVSGAYMDDAYAYIYNTFLNHMNRSTAYMLHKIHFTWLNKCGSHIANVDYIALILYWHRDLTLVHACAKHNYLWHVLHILLP